GVGSSFSQKDCPNPSCPHCVAAVVAAPMPTRLPAIGVRYPRVAPHGQLGTMPARGAFVGAAPLPLRPGRWQALPLMGKPQVGVAPMAWPRASVALCGKPQVGTAPVAWPRASATPTA
ncbi:hypothetical protein BHE74_00058482, partial [Ensete ventricosum]